MSSHRLKGLYPPRSSHLCEILAQLHKNAERSNISNIEVAQWSSVTHPLPGSDQPFHLNLHPPPATSPQPNRHDDPISRQERSREPCRTSGGLTNSFFHPQHARWRVTSFFSKDTIRVVGGRGRRAGFLLVGPLVGPPGAPEDIFRWGNGPLYEPWRGSNNEYFE